MGLGSGLMEITMAILSISIITLLVGNAGQTAQVVESAGGTLDQIVRTLTLQNRGYGMGGRYGRY